MHINHYTCAIYTHTNIGTHMYKHIAHTLFGPITFLPGQPTSEQAAMEPLTAVPTQQGDLHPLKLKAKMNYSSKNLFLD